MKDDSNHDENRDPEGATCRFKLWQVAPGSGNADRFPVPDWRTLDAWITGNVEERLRPDAWFHAATQWIEALRPALGPTYTVLSSHPVLLVGARSPNELAGLLTFTCHAVEVMGDYLRAVPRSAIPSALPVLQLNTLELYYDYVSTFYEDGEHATSAGMYITRGLPHVVLAPGPVWDLEATIAHELTHASLAELELPLWIEEGVAQILCQLIADVPTFWIDHELAARHRFYWGLHGLDEFWSGRSFGKPGDAQRLSYSLAEVLVRNIAADTGDRFYEFLCASERADAGDRAAREHLGKSLAQCAADFLGPGKWEPKPEAP